jgi:hypothetical protein
MNWAVYWQPGDDIECAFFRTEQEARDLIVRLIGETEKIAEDSDGCQPDWDITLLKVVGEVRQTPFKDSYALRYK